MKSNYKKLYQTFLFTAIFTLFCMCVSYTQTYADLEARNQQLLEGKDKNKNWAKNLGRGDIVIGYAHMPLRFGPTSVKSTLDGFPEVDQDLPAVNLQSGFNLQVNLNFGYRSYLGFHFSLLFSTKQESRKRDNAGFALITYGYRFPLQVVNGNHFFSLEAGFGFSNWERPLTNVERHRIHLTRLNLIVAPSVSYEINIYKKKTYLFFKYRFIYEIVNMSGDSGLGFKDKDSSSGITTRSLKNDHITTDANANLDLGNLSEFSIGFRFFIK